MEEIIVAISLTGSFLLLLYGAEGTFLITTKVLKYFVKF